MKRLCVVGSAVAAMLGPAAGAQDKAPSLTTETSPATGPAKWISIFDYPSAALRAGKEGAVAVTLNVGADGRPTACHITESSKSQSLDNATCSLLVGRARFVAGAADRHVKRRVIWHIQEELPHDAEPGKYFTPKRSIDIDKVMISDTVVDVELLIGYDGRVEQCRIVESTSSNDPDYCASTPKGMSTRPGYVRKGEPVKAIVRRRVSISTTFP